MEDIKDVSVESLEKGLFVKPFRINFSQNGKQKTWEAVETHDAVCILIFNVTRRCFVVVKQFRPAVYVNTIYNAQSRPALESTYDPNQYTGSCGVTHELCAGLVDKDKELAVIAKEEVLEECGYDVPVKNLEKVTTYRSGIGISGSTTTVFYAEVTDNMRVSQGGGNLHEGELIDVVDIPVNKGYDWVLDETVMRPPGMMFAFMWFYKNKPQHVK